MRQHKTSEAKAARASLDTHSKQTSNNRYSARRTSDNRLLFYLCARSKRSIEQTNSKRSYIFYSYFYRKSARECVCADKLQYALALVRKLVFYLFFIARSSHFVGLAALTRSLCTPDNKTCAYERTRTFTLSQASRLMARARARSIDSSPAV